MLHLHTLWYLIIAFFWTGFFLLEGFDFGVGALHAIVGRTAEERSTAIDSIGPFWDGNEVWLVVAGAATFAAFAGWYATMFSALYLALLLETDGPVRERSKRAARVLVWPATAAVLGFVIWTRVTAGPHIASPLMALAVIAVLTTTYLVYAGQEGWSFAASALTMATAVICIFTGLYPNVLVS